MSDDLALWGCVQQWSTTGSVSKIRVPPPDLESLLGNQTCASISFRVHCDKRTGYMHADFALQHKYSIGNTAKYKPMHSPGPNRMIYRITNPAAFYGKCLPSYRHNNNEFNPSGYKMRSQSRKQASITFMSVRLFARCAAPSGRICSNFIRGGGRGYYENLSTKAEVG